MLTDDVRLKNLAVAGGEKKFQGMIPNILWDFLNPELWNAQLYGLSGQLLAAEELARGLRDHEVPFLCAGDGASSTLLWLLGISDVDPMPAYYFDSRKGLCGLLWDAGEPEDLPEKQMEDGRRVSARGHNLRGETFWGLTPLGVHLGEVLHLRRDQAVLRLRVPEVHLQAVRDFLTGHSAFRGLEPEELPGGFRLGRLELEGCRELPARLSGFWAELTAAELRDYALGSFWEKEGLNRLPDTVKLPEGERTLWQTLAYWGLAHGTWEDYSVALGVHATGALPLMPTRCGVFFDDIRMLLSRLEPDMVKPWEEAQRLRSGQGLSQEALDCFEADVRSRLSRAKFLHSRGHAIACCRFGARLDRAQSR